MDLKQLEYIVAIADAASISQAAETLYITQSGLNQQLIKLEKELGLILFERGSHFIHLTQAGEIYVRNAREILRIKRSTYAQLSDLKKNITGYMMLGLTHGHGIDIFTGIFPEFHEVYPNIHIQLKEAVVKEQIRLIRCASLDLGIVMLRDQDRESDLEYYDICTEDFVLGVPLSHPMADLAAEPGTPMTVVDLGDFRRDVFSLIFKDSTMRKLIDPFFEEAGFHPDIMLETSMNNALVNLVSKGFCCTILPHSRMLANPLHKNCAWFRIKGNPRWNIYITARKDRVLSNADRLLIDLARQYGKVLSDRFLFQ